MAIPGNVGMKKTTFSSPAAMAQAQRAAESQSMKALQDRREQTRQDFFKGRPDISDNRLDRRQIQSDLYEKFKQEQMRPVVGASNLYQSRTPGGPTLADESIRLANLYGPTFKEIGSDIGYGLGSIAKGAGDFIAKGGVIGNVLSGLYDKFKGGTQQGIETVKGLYDNLRATLSGQPTVVTGGGSTMVTTSDGQPRVDLTPTSITTETLPAMDLSRNVGDESDPSIFGIDNAGVSLPYERSTIENPLYNQQVYKPFRVSDMDITGLTAQNFGLPSLQESYNFIRNPQLNTPYGNLRLDNVLSGRPELGYANTVMINGVPVDLSATIGNQGLNIGGSFSFKDGGSVDKYAGLGYKLK